MANDIEFGVKVTNVAAAITDVNRVTAATDATRRSVASAATATAASATQARSSLNGLGAAATNVGGRVGQLGGAFGQMTSSLGALSPVLGRAGGVISQLGGTISSLTGAMGPLGVALGAATAASSALGAAMAAQDEAMAQSRVRAQELTRTLSQLIAVQRQQREDASLDTRLRAGGGTADEQLGFQQQSQNRVDMITRALNGDSGALAELRGSGQLASTRTSLSLTERLTTGRLGTSDAPGEGAGEVRQLESMLQAALRENQQRINLIGVAAEGLGQQAAALNAETDAAIARGASSRPSGGGGGRSAASSEEAAFTREMVDLTRELAQAEAQRTQQLLSQKDKIAEAQEAEREAAMAAAQLEQEHTQALLDAANAKAEAQKALAQTSAEAAETFRSSWTGGINEVIAAWETANEALAAAGESQLSTAALLEVGMNSAANSIADTVGGTMVSAFETAVGAWLDGSKTFAEAAEDMVKSVLRSLVIESIVQGVVELARGIASAASMDFAGAALHFGAAAAWAAVGVVAGSVGAGIGAFGGGASKGGTATSAEAPRETAQNNQQPAGTTIVNVYPGGFVTRGEVVAGVYDAINEGSRMGMTFDGASVGA